MFGSSQYESAQRRMWNSKILDNRDQLISSVILESSQFRPLRPGILRQ
jgi:hypothetical protein